MHDDVGPHPADVRSAPLFPLPNVVHFPHAILPLHVFEERYRAMTADALDGSRLIAMALLKPGWEKSYHGRAEIEPVVCVGQIVSHEKLANGCYNMLLRGIARARVTSEAPPSDVQLYRMAQLEPLHEVPADPIALAEQRHAWEKLLNVGSLSRVPLAPQLREMLERGMPIDAIADIAAFTLLDDIKEKQSLLAEIDVQRRIERTIQLLVARADERRTQSIQADLN